MARDAPNKLLAGHWPSKQVALEKMHAFVQQIVTLFGSFNSFGDYT